MYEIKVTITEQEEAELKPLYEETCRIFAAAGREPLAFTTWYMVMLTLGSLPHIKANAELLNEQTRNKYNIKTE